MPASGSNAKASLVDEAFLAESSKKKTPTKRKADSSIAGLVKKKLYDNFREFGTEEIDGIVDENGKTFRDHLTEAIAKSLEDPVKNKIGPTLYNDLKKKFRSSNSPQAKLEATETEEGEMINPHLMKAAVAYQKTKNKAIFNWALHMLDTVTLTDVVGICQYGLDSTDNWVAVQAQLTEVCQTAIGMRLFGSGFRSVQSEVVRAGIEQQVNAFFKTKLDASERITEAAWLNLKQIILNDLAAKDCIAGMAERRMIKVEYLQQSVELLVRSLNDEAEYVFAAAWKTKAVQLGLIPPLFCELELATPKAEDKKWSDIMLLDLIERNKGARARAKEEVAAGTRLDFEAIVAQLNRRESHLLTMDFTMVVEINLFRSMGGDYGAQKLQEQFLKLLPSESRFRPVEEVVQELEPFPMTELFKFVSTSTQNLIRNAIDAVHAVAEGREPNIGTSAGPFLITVKARMQLFCVHTATDGKKTTGTDAIKSLVQTPQNKKPDTVVIDDIKFFMQFEWMLDASDKQAFKDLKDQVRRNEEVSLANGGAAAASARSPKRARASQAKGANGKKQKTEVAAALSMFKTVAKPKAKAEA